MIKIWINKTNQTFKSNKQQMPIINLVYEEAKGWKPNENTYIYYPLTSDLVDVMWNGNTGVAHGNVTFKSTSWSDTWCYVQWQSWIYVTGMSIGITWRTTCTLNYWANFVSQEQYAALVWHSGYYDNEEPSKLVCDISGSNTYTRLWLKGSGWNFYFTDAYAYPINHWYHNYCITLDNGSLRMYLDWRPAHFLRNSSGDYETYNAGTVQNWSGASELQLWYWGRYWNARRSTWYVRDFIVETIPRTAQEISDYYNQTKSNYWL